MWFIFLIVHLKMPTVKSGINYKKENRESDIMIKVYKNPD